MALCSHLSLDTRETCPHSKLTLRMRRHWNSHAAPGCHDGQCVDCCPAGAVDAVGTTGFWDISPNAVNSVPRGAKLEMDVRDIDGARRDATVASIKKKVLRCIALVTKFHSNCPADMTCHGYKNGSGEGCPALCIPDSDLVRAECLLRHAKCLYLRLPAPQAKEIAARRKVGLELEMINQDDPATCSPQVGSFTCCA